MEEKNGGNFQIYLREGSKSCPFHVNFQVNSNYVLQSNI